MELTENTKKQAKIKAPEHIHLDMDFRGNWDNLVTHFPHQSNFLSLLRVILYSKNVSMNVLIELISFISQNILNLCLLTCDLII